MESFFYDFQPALTLPSRSIISVTTFSSKKMLELVPVPMGIKVQVLPRGSLLPNHLPSSQNNAEAPEVGRGDPRECPRGCYPVARSGTGTSLRAAGMSRTRHHLTEAFSLRLFFFFPGLLRAPPAKVSHLSLAMENKCSLVAKKERDGFPWQLPSQMRVTVTCTTRSQTALPKTITPGPGRGEHRARCHRRRCATDALQQLPHHQHRGGLFMVSLQIQVLGGPGGELRSPRASSAHTQKPGSGAGAEPGGQSKAIFLARQPKVIIGSLGPSSISAV